MTHFKVSHILTGNGMDLDGINDLDKTISQIELWSRFDGIRNLISSEVYSKYEKYPDMECVITDQFV